MVAAEVHAYKDGSWPFPLVREHKQQMDLRHFRRPEADGHFAERRFTAERLAVFTLHFTFDLFRCRGKIAVHVILEKGLQLGPALVEPLLLAGTALTVEHHERIGQVRVHGHSIDFRERSLGQGNGRRDQEGQKA